MSKIQNKIEIKDLIIIVILILLVIINLILYIKKVIIPKEQQENFIESQTTVIEEKQQQTNETVSVPQTEEEIKKYLSTLGERDRMEYYCGQYIKHLKHKEYEQAYNMLYTEFKQNYFPTIEQYEEYVKNFYPDYFALQYDDISRQGNIYVLRLKIIDAMNSEDTEQENIQRIVIRENDYNDFELSFQVK